jgi:hypothetical protein
MIRSGQLGSSLSRLANIELSHAPVPPPVPVGVFDVVSDNLALIVTLPVGINVESVMSPEAYRIDPVTPGAMPMQVGEVAPHVVDRLADHNAHVMNATTVRLPGARLDASVVGGYLFLASPLNPVNYAKVVGYIRPNRVVLSQGLVTTDPASTLGAIPYRLTTGVVGLTLAVNEPTDGATYLFTTTLRLPSGKSVTYSKTFIAHAVRPQLFAARALSEGQIVVTFNEPMRNERSLMDPTQYEVSGPTIVEVVHVRPQTSTQVVLETRGMVAGAYTLDISPSIRRASADNATLSDDLSASISILVVSTGSVILTDLDDTAVVSDALSTSISSVVLRSSFDNADTSDDISISVLGPAVVTSVSPDLGDTLGGELLTIIGTGFLAGGTATAVSIGGTAAVGFSVLSDTEIIAIAPAHAAATGQSILVTTPGGTNTANSLYEFWSIAELALTGFWERGDYDLSAATWSARASAGLSGGRALTQVTAGNVPSETNLEPIFDGLNDRLVSPALAPDSYVGYSAGTIIAIADVRSFVADAGASLAYNNPAFFASASGSLTFGFSDSGLRGQLYDGAYREPPAVALSTGLHMTMARWNGVSFDQSVDGGAVSSTPAGTINTGGLGATTLYVGCNYNATKFLPGTLRLLATIDSALSDVTIAKVLKWGQSRHGVPVIPALAGALNFSRVDITGGGQRVVVPVADSTGCIAITAGGVPFTAFAIDDATHVSGVPGAHESGLFDLLVFTASGPIARGALRYWSPLEVTGVTRYFEASQGVTSSSGAVSQWVEQKNSKTFTQSAGANKPVLAASAFGTVPGIQFTPQQWLMQVSGTDGETAMSPWSLFAVAKTTNGRSAVTTTAYNTSLNILGGSGWSGFGISSGGVSHAVYNRPGEVHWGSGLADGVPHIFGVTGTTGPSEQGYIDGSAVGSPVTTGDPLYYWDRIGTGLGNVDGFDGTIGMILTCKGTVISSGDIIALHEWAQQRYGAT